MSDPFQALLNGKGESHYFSTDSGPGNADTALSHALLRKICNWFAIIGANINTPTRIHTFMIIGLNGRWSSE